jgi:hypothetical protein
MQPHDAAPAPSPPMWGLQRTPACDHLWGLLCPAQGLATLARAAELCGRGLPAASP